MFLWLARRLVSELSQNRRQWIRDLLPHSSFCWEFSAAPLTPVFRHGSEGAFANGELSRTAEWATYRRDPSFEVGQRGLGHQDTNHRRIELYPVDLHFRIGLIEIRLSRFRLERMDMNPFGLSASACPNKGWIRAPDLNASTEFGLTDV